MWQFAAHSTASWAFTFVLAVLFPLLDWLIYSRAKSRMAIYAWNVAAEWSLVVACIWITGMLGITASGFGEQLGNPRRTAIVCGILVIAVAALTLLNRMQRKKASDAEMSKAIANVRRLIPATRAERMAFIVVALTAGICEELLYRGWLLNLFGAAFRSVWLGLLISSLLFGIAHIYQGRRGVIGTAVIGLMFGAIFIACGSLFPGQVLHAVMDLNNGLALGRIAERTADPV